MTSLEHIEITVHKVLQSLVARGMKIENHHRLVKDLKLADDDDTAMALRLEKILNVRIDRKIWNTVETAQDTIDALFDACSE